MIRMMVRGMASGGHIERLIGTAMSKLKSLPGATGGSPKARRSYDPDKHAALTLGELEAWFAQQIVGRYHQDPHRGLKGGTPAGAWALHPAPGLPPGPLKRFRIAFLPAINRTLRRDGMPVRRERAVLDQDAAARATRCIEAREHQVQVDRQRVHRDDFLRVCA